MRNQISLIAFLFVIIQGCSVKKKVVSNAFQDDINQSHLNDHFFGVSLVRVEDNNEIISHHAHKLFIPASNTKILTYYAASKFLADSIASFKYAYSEKKDSLILWPQGDGTFLNEKFNSQKAFDFLKTINKKIYVVSDTYEGEKYGYGWAWDDYNEHYQAQISDVSIYGNTIKVLSKDNKIKLNPDLVSMYLADTNYFSDLKKGFREFQSNNISLPKKFSENFKQTIPLNIDYKTFCVLLADTLLATESFTKEVKPISYRNVNKYAKTIFNESVDSVLKIMLQQSDNFLAEQLLLNIAFKHSISTKQTDIINFIKQSQLQSLPDTLQWVDGSGLSRQNLNSPRNFTHILNLIYKEFGEDKAFTHFSAGGLNGTLKNQFVSDSVFVYAKSGTLSNNYCLSGFLIGKSGKRYVFSILNNNFSLSTKTVKGEVENLITKWRENL